MRVPNDVRESVVFIGLPVGGGLGKLGISFRGTGFFVSVPSEVDANHLYIYLVTARHVAMHLMDRQFVVRMNMRDGTSGVYYGQGLQWWTHPSDQLADVAVTPFVPDFNAVEYRAAGVDIFLNREIAASKHIGPGDEVFITGLFAHMSGTARNLPIVRMGNVAMLPDEPVPTAIGMMEAYLIEARSIGGLSGSPVFVRETTGIGLGSFYLLGLMHGHWDIPPEDKNGAFQDLADEHGKVNLGIAIVVPAQKILETLQHPQLVAQRRAGDAQLRQGSKG